MALEIKTSGKLIHIFRSSLDNDSQIRHSLQILSEPKNGEDKEKFELASYKLPKGTNYQSFADKIGCHLEVSLKQWSQGERSGFFIASVSDILITKESSKVKAA